MTDAAPPMLTTGELAARADYSIGPVQVSPATRTIRGPAGDAVLEPRVAQLLTVLADAKGAVVTRDTLFARCWGTAQVADDSLNRAVATARKVLAQVAGSAVEIETIPRTGYRLAGTGDVRDDAKAPARSPVLSRRGTLVAGAAIVGAVGAGAWFARAGTNRDFEALVQRGEQLMLYGGPAVDPTKPLRQALDLRPKDARALGLLALAQTRFSQDSVSSPGGSALLESARFARAALAIDPDQPAARVALIKSHKHEQDFAATEDQLKAALRSAPDNVWAMHEYWRLLQCVGRSREGLQLVERALSLRPLAAEFQYPQGQFLWILGHPAQADRVSEQVVTQWPNHSAVRFARFTILAFTGRPRAALAMIENPATAPQLYNAKDRAIWRISLPALDGGSPSQVAAAVEANVEAAKQDLTMTSQAVMVLSALGALDSAFELANALFVVDPPEGTVRNGSTAPSNSLAWRFAPWLFTPPIAPMRADRRFLAICAATGLSDYWRARGVRPDFPIAGL